MKGRIGFVLSEDPKVKDVLIEGASLRLAMDGDRVKARIVGVKADRRLGELSQVLEHSRTNIVGTYFERHNEPYVESQADGTWIRIKDLAGTKPAQGDLILVHILEWPTKESHARGQVIQVLGRLDDLEVDLPTVLYQYNLATEFPKQVESEAIAFGDEVPETEWKSRETLFHLPVFTIDGADAKDFDDAVSIEKKNNGHWVLGVHIADVSHYVREGSALDGEAYARATSVYFPRRVIPMLPFPLSDNLCSLRPECVRLTLSCFMEISKDGKVVSHRLAETAIRSAKRFTYEEVQLLLDGQPNPRLPSEIIQAVNDMGRLAKLLREKRFARGSLDFDFPEPSILFGSDGRPIDMQKKSRLESHRLVEEFMLLANETVAQDMQASPFLYRVHETPNPEKLLKLKETLKAVGIKVPKGFEDGDPAALQKILSLIENQPYELLIETLLLRSLKQAQYSPINRGHYGLASKHYAHFTSPIRRYPDLIVHRLIREKVRKKNTSERKEHWKALLPKIALHCSKQERVAVEAEREYWDILKVRLMEKHVGDVFEGVISSITSFGLFVQLNQFFVEGLVHVSTLQDDYYVYDEVRVTLSGRRTNRVFQMGQTVQIQIAACNRLKHQLDFQLTNNSSKRK